MNWPIKLPVSVFPKIDEAQLIFTYLNGIA